MICGDFATFRTFGGFRIKELCFAEKPATWYEERMFSDICSRKLDFAFRSKGLKKTKTSARIIIKQYQ